MDAPRILQALWLLLTILIFNKSLVAAVFENCDHKFRIYAGYTYELISDHYPNSYAPGSSCRYKYTAPAHNIIVANCAINADKGPNGCTTENVYVAKDGNINLQGSEKLCGAGTFTRTSLDNTLVLAYISGGSVGNFKCILRVQSKPCDCGYSVSKNIANGVGATINEYPSVVALKTRSPNNYFFCAGIIISNRYLLTAAHCARFTNREDIVAWVGTHNIQSTTNTIYTTFYFISKIIIHPQYSPDPVNNDIALLQTSTEIRFSRGVGPICLPPLSNANNDFAWERVDVIGWGADIVSGSPSATLQKITLMVMDYESCKTSYQDTDHIYPTQMCTRDISSSGKDSCQFDSGGPVIFRHLSRQYLVGIVSYGKVCAAVKDPIGVNTRITPYLTWILSNTNGGTCSPKI